MTDGRKPARTDAPAPSDPAATEWSVRSVHNIAIAVSVVLTFFVLHALRHLLAPLLIAIVLGLLIDGEAAASSRWFTRWPKWTRVAMGTVLTVGGFAVLVVVTMKQAAPFAAEFGGLQGRLDHDLAIIAAHVGMAPITLSTLTGGRGDGHLTGRLLGIAQGVAGDAGLVLLYLAFLLGSRGHITQKIDHLSAASSSGRASFERIIGRVGRSVSEFVSLQAFKGSVVGGAAAIVGTLFGVPNSLFAGIIGFFVAFIPAIGTYLGALLPALAALALYPDPGTALRMGAVLIAFVALFDSVVLPRLQSDRLNLDLTVGMLGIGFWGLIFGGPGVLLSTPLTATCLALAAEFASTRWIAVILSQKGHIDWG